MIIGMVCFGIIIGAFLRTLFDVRTLVNIYNPFFQAYSFLT